MEESGNPPRNRGFWETLQNPDPTIDYGPVFGRFTQPLAEYGMDYGGTALTQVENTLDWRFGAKWRETDLDEKLQLGRDVGYTIGSFVQREKYPELYALGGPVGRSIVVKGTKVGVPAAIRLGYVLSKPKLGIRTTVAGVKGTLHSQKKSLGQKIAAGATAVGVAYKRGVSKVKQPEKLIQDLAQRGGAVERKYHQLGEAFRPVNISQRLTGWRPPSTQKVRKRVTDIVVGHEVLDPDSKLKLVWDALKGKSLAGPAYEQSKQGDSAEVKFDPSSMDASTLPLGHPDRTSKYLWADVDIPEITSTDRDTEPSLPTEEDSEHDKLEEVVDEPDPNTEGSGDPYCISFDGVEYCKIGELEDNNGKKTKKEVKDGRRLGRGSDLNTSQILPKQGNCP